MTGAMVKEWNNRRERKLEFELAGRKQIAILDRVVRMEPSENVQCKWPEEHEGVSHAYIGEKSIQAEGIVDVKALLLKRVWHSQGIARK